MAFGVTSAGFNGKTLTDIKPEIEAGFRGEFGANCDLEPNSPDGQLIGIISDLLAELWQLAGAVYAAQDPDKATGQAQDAVCAITGTTRDPAAPSRALLTCTGSDATFLATGREVSVVPTGERFATLADVTTANAGLYANSTAYVVGDFLRTAFPRVYVCITAGTTSGAGTGPAGTAADITDGTAHFRYVGEGPAYAQVEVEAAVDGPTSAVSGTLTQIETPVSGWSSAVNLEDAVLGQNTESNDGLRVKREAELAASGSGTLPAIRAAVLKVPEVTSCVVFQNTGNVTDADGRPPHSVEAVVEGGADAAIAAALFVNVSAGIQPYGTTIVAVTDSQGNPWNVGLSRPSALTLWVRVDVVKDPLVFPVDGSDQIKAAIVGDEPNYPIGKDAVSSRISSRCFQIPGVLDVTLCYIRLISPPVASTTIAAGPRDRMQLDSSRVTVNVVDGVP